VCRLCLLFGSAVLSWEHKQKAVVSCQWAAGRRIASLVHAEVVVLLWGGRNDAQAQGPALLT